MLFLIPGLSCLKFIMKSRCIEMLDLRLWFIQNIIVTSDGPFYCEPLFVQQIHALWTHWLQDTFTWWPHQHVYFPSNLILFSHPIIWNNLYQSHQYCLPSLLCYLKQLLLSIKSWNVENILVSDIFASSGLIWIISCVTMSFYWKWQLFCSSPHQ